MLLNQFVASTIDFHIKNRGRKLSFSNLIIWADESLEVTLTQKPHQKLLLIGFIFDPRSPNRTNQEILDQINSFKFLSNEFFNEINILTGRFVIVAEANNKCIVLNDPAAQRQVYYHFHNECVFFGSSPKLIYEILKKDFLIPNNKKKIIESKRFKVLEQWFPGDEFMDDNLKRLLPNFYLDISKKNTLRIPVQFRTLDKSQIKHSLSNLIYGSLEACSNRFEKVMFAITAGSDSRLLLNYSPKKENIFYFLYKRENENNIDRQIAQQLANKKNITLNVLEPKNLSSDFLDKYKSQFLRPRILSKLRNIELLKNKYANSNTVVIAGYAGELLRNSTNSINPYHRKFETANDFVNYLNYPSNSYLHQSMSDWIKTTKEYLDNSKNLNLLDLFHWEHHMAPYCAQYSYEQDFSSVEIFCPLANRQMIFDLIHNTTAKERSNPNGIIYQLIKEVSPEWNEIPYNPKPFIKIIKDKIFKVLPISIVNRMINR